MTLNSSIPDSVGPDHSRRQRSKPALITLLVGITVAGYGTDQGTKAWASATLDPNRPKQLVGSLLQLHLIRNPGAAFSIATNATLLLTVITVAVICVTIFSARRLRSKPWACALGLLIGGALGNFTDRFFREPGAGRGHVMDFLQFPHWPIFNVADMCVVTAACLIALLALHGIGIDGSRLSDDESLHHDDGVGVDDGTTFDSSADVNFELRARDVSSSDAIVSVRHDHC